MEEQDQEVEALKAIFMDDYHEISAVNPRKFSLSLWPTVGEQNANVGCSVVFAFTSTYPQEVPPIEINILKGLTATTSAQLKALLVQKANENIGSGMVFNIVTAAKEWLDDMDAQVAQDREVAAKVQEAAEAERERIQHEKEEAEAARKRGTPVTRETFKQWNDSFMASLRAAQAAIPQSSSGRLTGKQLFEQDASMIMSDDVFIRTMEANMGSSTAADTPPVERAVLLSDPDNAHLFDADSADDFRPPLSDDELEELARDDVHKPEKPEKPQAKPAAVVPSVSKASPEPSKSKQTPKR